MARKRRTLSNQGIYHVHNRAELGLPIFESDGAKSVFLETVFDVTGRLGWQLHAFAVMSNHFHLGVTTPGGDLDIGMHRILSAFSNKHAAFRGCPGHVFQSRYGAHHYPLGPKAGTKIDYIHLNPVAAGIIPFDALRDYPWTSFRSLWHPELRSGLVLGSTIGLIYGLRDDHLGWEAYEQRLRATHISETHGPSDEELFKLVRKNKVGSLPRLPGIPPELGKRGDTLRAERQAKLEQLLVEELAKANLTDADLAGMSKGAQAKLNLALAISSKAIVDSAWLATRLHMGSASYVRKLLSSQGVRPLPSPPVTKLPEKPSP